MIQVFYVGSARQDESPYSFAAVLTERPHTFLSLGAAATHTAADAAQTTHTAADAG